MELYVQLTEKCNMSCEHCCMNATGKGTLMSREVFEKCLEIAKDRGQGMTLGGGEPTLHPNLLEWAMEAALATIETSMDMDGPSVLVVTNGKKTETALKLAKLGHLGVISAELSQDEWHDPIDPKVVAEFSRYNGERFRPDNRKGHSGIRDVTGGVKNMGRAKENGIGDHDGCACSAMFIAPNGDFYKCGCKVKKLGNILKDEIPDEAFDGECGHHEPVLVNEELVPA